MMMVTNHLTQDWTKTAIDYVLMFREFDIDFCLDYIDLIYMSEI